ncbi:MAG: CRISPR-associated endoribonuclease Cas6, partial [Candidatus Kryptonium sp.]
MRFSIFYKLSKDTIPIDYRRGIISLLKKAFENSNIEIYKNFYENKNNITKPFTFSVYLPYSNIKENEIV